ncbi:hypothetical protein PBY51_012647 [Eleginops maclovinus]|uniref:Uncharacterized protein n=1 Tax=Eleginops maclovinus TaxID=56733 RepID=A0AAN7Y6X5_ELEMC|nr:hypothetical protein PBY51_012647 [Eleginops maclovinus]
MSDLEISEISERSETDSSSRPTDTDGESVESDYVGAYQDEPLALPGENERRQQEVDEDGIWLFEYHGRVSPVPRVVPVKRPRLTMPLVRRVKSLPVKLLARKAGVLPTSNGIKQKSVRGAELQAIKSELTQIKGNIESLLGRLEQITEDKHIPATELRKAEECKSEEAWQEEEESSSELEEGEEHRQNSEAEEEEEDEEEEGEHTQNNNHNHMPEIGRLSEMHSIHP